MIEELKLVVRRLLVSTSAVLLLVFGLVAHGQSAPAGFDDFSVKANDKREPVLTWSLPDDASAPHSYELWARYPGTEANDHKDVEDGEAATETITRAELDAFLGSDPKTEIIFGIRAKDAEGAVTHRDSVQAASSDFTALEVFNSTAGTVSLAEGPLKDEALADINALLEGVRGLNRVGQRTRSLTYKVVSTPLDTVGDAWFSAAPGVKVILKSELSNDKIRELDFETASHKQVTVTIEATEEGVTATDHIYSLTINLLDVDEAPIPQVQVDERRVFRTYEPGVAITPLPDFLATRDFRDPEGKPLTVAVASEDGIRCDVGKSSEAHVPTLNRVVTGGLLVSHSLVVAPGVEVGDYVCRSDVMVKDPAGKKGGFTFVVEIRVGPNTPPIFAGSAETASRTTDENTDDAFPGGIEVFDFNPNDNSEDGLKATTNVKGLTARIREEEDGKLRLHVDALMKPVVLLNHEALPDGVLKYTITLSDKYGGTDTLAVTLTVNDVDESPEWRNVSGLQNHCAYVEVGTPCPIPLSVYAKDPEEELLTFIGFSRNTDEVEVDVNGSVATIKAVSNGNPDVFFIATDPSGRSKSSGDISIQTRAEGENLAPSFDPPGEVFEAITVSIPEDAEVGSTVGPLIVAVDPNPTDKPTYTLEQSDGAFAVDPKTGLITVSSTAPINFESKAEDEEFQNLHFELIACDGLLLCDSVDVTVQVTDVNEKPQLVSKFTPIPSQEVLVDSEISFDVNRYFYDEDFIDRDRLRIAALVINSKVVSAEVEYGVTSEGHPTANLLVKGFEEGNTHVILTAYDHEGESIEAPPFKVDVLPNEPPVIASPIADDVFNLGDPPILISLSDVFEDEDSLQFSTPISDSSSAVLATLVDDSTLAVYARRVGTAIVEVTATDRSGATITDSFVVRVNAIPVVALTLNDIVVGSNGGKSNEIELSEVFSDPDGDKLTFNATSADELVATVEVIGSSLVVTGLGSGLTSISVTATDGVPNSSVSTSFNVRVNTSPVVVAAPPNITIQGIGITSDAIDLTSVFSDPDADDELTYSATSSDASVATVALSGSAATITSVSPGTATVTLTATDGFVDSSTSTSFDITVKSLPQIASVIASVSLQVGGEVATRELGNAFSDADGDTLSYMVNLSGNVATASIAGSTLTISPVSSGSASATITATDVDGNSASQSVSIEVSNSDLKAVANNALAAIGRAMLGSATNAVGTRIAKARPEDSSGSSSFSEFVHSLASVSSSSFGQTPSSSTSASNASFVLGTGMPIGQKSSGLNTMSLVPRQFSALLGANGAGSFAVWGAGDTTSFEGASYEGTLTGLHLGADLTTAECWLIGVAISSSSGDVDFTYGTADRTLETSVTAFTPYVRYEPDELSAIWAAGSFGSGDADVTGGPVDSVSDLESQLFLVGGRREFTNTGNFSLAIRGEATSGSLSTDSGSDLASGLDVSVSRVRGVIEATLNTSDNGFEPFIDVGFRNDGGDGDTGSGLEVSGGIRLNSDAFSLEARAHTVASHGADDYSESGFSVVARVSPNGANGTGFAINFEPTWGAMYRASDLMWQLDRNVSVQQIGQRLYGAVRNDGVSINTRISYGVLANRDRALISPFFDIKRQNEGYSRYMFGAEFQGATKEWRALSVHAAIGAEADPHSGTQGIVGLSARLSL